jgi:hypothetical protein
VLVSEMAIAWRHRAARSGEPRRADAAMEPAPRPAPRLRISRGGWAILLAMLGSALIWALLIATVLRVIRHG